MTSSNKMRLSVVDETSASPATMGTTPTSPVMLVLEASSQSFVSPSAPKAESANIRTDGRIKSTVPLNRSAPGGFSADLVYPTVNQGLWTVMRAAMNAAEESQVVNADACTLGATNTITRLAGSFITDGFDPGDIVKISGASGLDNRYGLVTNVVALTLTLQLVAFQGMTAAWATPGTLPVTVTRAARMRDSTATTERAFTAEVAWLDLQKMFVATGQVASSLRLSFAMGQKATVQVGFTGRDVVGSNMASATVGITGATYTSPTELPVFSPAKAIYVAIAGVSYPVSALSVEWTRAAMVGHSTEGGATPDRVSTGALRVKLSWSAYFAVVTAITQATAGTEVSLWFVMEDGGGKALSVSCGTVVVESASVQTGGMDQIEMVNASGSATHNETNDAVSTFQRWQ